MVDKKLKGRSRIKRSIRNKIHGTAEKPRLSVFRSNKHVVGQVIDDDKGETLIAVATYQKDFSDIKGNKSELATKAGEELAKKANEKGISNIVFDRSGYRYHGRIKAFAEGARKGGLKF
jgi:large subunit ribosomal protein L18